MNYESLLFARAGSEVNRDADLSPCLRYRYALKRWWTDEGPWASWIMLNPSTADAAVDDPTIRKCMKFSRDWGMAGMTVVNLFAWRSPNPKDLLTCEDPIGPENDWWIKHVIGLTDGPVIAAWGSEAIAAKRSVDVLKMIATVQLKCLKLSKGGNPWHPLYVAGSEKLIDFKGGVK